MRRPRAGLVGLLVGYAAAVLATVKLAPDGGSLTVAASAGRLAYGAACEVAPHRVGGTLAAEMPGSSLNLRGFGGQHIAIAIFTLLCLQSPAYTRLAVRLNIGIEVCDLLSGGLELRDQGADDNIAVGAVALPILNLAAWLSALRAFETTLA